MEANLASAAATRISQLWPTLNCEQLRLTTKTLLSTEFDSIVVADAIAKMYMNDTKFFDLAELTRRVRQSKDAPDPLSQPNSYESRTARRREENRRWEQQHIGTEKLREWWAGLGESDRTDMIEMFKQTQAFTSLKDFYEAQFGKGRAPIPFLQWAHDEARRATRI